MPLNFLHSFKLSLDRPQVRRSMGNPVTHNPTLALAVSEAVILVVGNDSEHKRNVAQAIASALGATEEEVSKAGVRVFAKESSPAVPVVVDTVPLSIGDHWGRVDAARVWISQNCLRRLCGKRVFVVCVIASTDPGDEIYQEPHFEGNRFSWLQLLAFIFEQHKQELFILVNSEDATDGESRTIPRLREILKRDGFRNNKTKFFDFGREFTPSMNSILQDIFITSGDANGEATAGNKSTIAVPFLLRGVAPNASEKDRFGPWGPENLILFGRTGSGKSTLAQMLTSGVLDAHSKKFSASSMIRGETTAVKSGQGRGWGVTDTPGLGESVIDAKSRVTTAEAGRLVKEYVMLQNGTFNHFIYVLRKGRLDDLDERLWEVFVLVFGAERIQTHMTIVVSEADQEWLDDNITALRECFKGCESFTTADFPEPEEDEAVEMETQGLRLESLKALEDDLASLGRVDVCCKLGVWSVGTQLSKAIRGTDERVTLRSHIRQSPAFGSPVEQAHPSDYLTARVTIRLRSLTSKIRAKCLPSVKEVII